jgi:hypothetical protein
MIRQVPTAERGTLAAQSLNSSRAVLTSCGCAGESSMKTIRRPALEPQWCRVRWLIGCKSTLSAGSSPPFIVCYSASGRGPRSPSDQARRIPKLEPGTILIREWSGIKHQVVILENGVSLRGHHYRSLSKVARQITSSCC